MQSLRQIGAVLVLGAVVAACGGNAATKAPDGGTGGNGGNGGNGNGGATQQPAATQGGGGNGGNGGNTIDTTYGKVTFTTTGPVATSGEYGFIPAGSMFGGSAGSVLNFASSAGSDANLVSIATNPDGSVVVSFTSSTLGQVPGATCTTTDWNIGSGTGSGKFDCTASISISASGAAVAGGTIKGEFTAHT